MINWNSVLDAAAKEYNENSGVLAADTLMKMHRLGISFGAVEAHALICALADDPVDDQTASRL